MGRILHIERFVVQTTPKFPAEILAIGCSNARWGNCGGPVGYTRVLNLVLCSKHAANAGIGALEISVHEPAGSIAWDVNRYEDIPSGGAQVRGLLQGSYTFPLHCPECGKEIPPSRSTRHPQNGPPELEFFCPEGHNFTVAVGELIKDLA